MAKRPWFQFLLSVLVLDALVCWLIHPLVIPFFAGYPEDAQAGSAAIASSWHLCHSMVEKRFIYSLQRMKTQVPADSPVTNIN